MFGKEEQRLQNIEIEKLHKTVGSLDKHSVLGQVFEGTERFAKQVIQNGSGFSLIETIQRLQNEVEELKQKVRIAEQMEKNANSVLKQSRGNNTLSKVAG